MILDIIWMVWLFSLNLVLDEDKISYSSIFSKREIYWTELEKIYYKEEAEENIFEKLTRLEYTVDSAFSLEYAPIRDWDFRTSLSYYENIPLTTTYKAVLKDKNNVSIKTDIKFFHAKGLRVQIIDKANSVLFKNLVSKFNSCVDVDFDGIVVNKIDGMKIQGLLGERRVPMEDIDNCAILDKNLNIFMLDGTILKIPVKRIASLFVLCGILAGVFFRKPAQVDSVSEDK